MKTSRKLIAVLLCFSMIPCLFLTGFAEGEIQDGDVLFSATFNGSAEAPKTLDEAGLEIVNYQLLPEEGLELQAAVNAENGYLNASSLGTKYNKLVIKENVLGSVTTYTVQLTFRWITTDGNRAAGMQLGFSEGAQTADFNLRYNYEIASGTSKVDGYGNLDKEVVRHWKHTANIDGEEVPGKWVTVTMQVINGRAGKLTINVDGVPEVVFEAPAASHAEKLLKDRLFLMFCRVNVEIYDYRVVAGVNVPLQTPAQPPNPANAIIPADPVPAGASESGTVLYYQRFDPNFHLTLGNVGLIFPSIRDVSFVNGYLAADSVGQGARTFALLPVALSSELGSYTLECTFRFSNPETYKQGSMILNLGGENIELRYEKDGTYGTTESTFMDQWKISPNTGVGRWITMKLQVEENLLTAVNVTVNGETRTFSGATLTQATKTIPATGNLSLASYHAGVQLGCVRLVAGADYTQFAGPYASTSFSGDPDPADMTFPEATLPPSIAYEDGKVLYYQFFDQSFELSNLSETGLISPENFATIGSKGYLEGENIGKGYNCVVILPDVIPAGLTTYTIETTFRFANKDTNKSGGVQIGWGEGTDAKIDVNLRYYKDGQFDKIGTVDQDVALSWLADFMGPGNWITLKIHVKDGKLFKVTIDLEDVLLGKTYHWAEEAPEYQGDLPMGGQLFIQQGSASVQYRSFRLVEGVDYTEYTGEYATKSFSGHDDPLVISNERDIIQGNDPTPPDPKGTEEITTEAPGGSPNVEKPKRGSKKILPIVISVAVVLLLVAGGIAIFFSKRKKTDGKS